MKIAGTSFEDQDSICINIFSFEENIVYLISDIGNNCLII